MATPSRILLVSGSTRSGSTNTAALRTVRAELPEGLTASLYDGLGRLPAFNPDDDRDPLPDAVAELRQRIALADAVLFCTPEYAGALPGSFKNLLDWIVGGGELLNKPVAWMNVAAQGRGTRAHESLRTVLSYLGAAIVEDACLCAPVGRETLGPDSTVTDSTFRREVSRMLRQLQASLSVSDET